MDSPFLYCLVMCLRHLKRRVCSSPSPRVRVQSHLWVSLDLRWPFQQLWLMGLCVWLCSLTWSIGSGGGNQCPSSFPSPTQFHPPHLPQNVQRWQWWNLFPVSSAMALTDTEDWPSGTFATLALAVRAYDWRYRIGLLVIWVILSSDKGDFAHIKCRCYGKMVIVSTCPQWEKNHEQLCLLLMNRLCYHTAEIRFPFSLPEIPF